MSDKDRGYDSALSAASNPVREHLRPAVRDEGGRADQIAALDAILGRFAPNFASIRIKLAEHLYDNGVRSGSGDPPAGATAPDLRQAVIEAAAFLDAMYSGLHIKDRPIEELCRAHAKALRAALSGAAAPGDGMTDEQVREGVRAVLDDMGMDEATRSAVTEANYPIIWRQTRKALQAARVGSPSAAPPDPISAFAYDSEDFQWPSLNATELERIDRESAGTSRLMTVGLWTYGYVEGSEHQRTEPKTCIGHTTIGDLKTLMRLKALLRSPSAAPGTPGEPV